MKCTTYTHDGLPPLCVGLDHDEDEDDYDYDYDDERDLNAKRAPTFNSVQRRGISRGGGSRSDVPLKPETIT